MPKPSSSTSRIKVRAASHPVYGNSPRQHWIVIGLLCWRSLERKGRATGLYTRSAGKTDSAVRNIPLTPRTREMLLARRELMIGPKGAERRCGDNAYVFPGDGNSGHLVTVQHAHEKAMTDAELEKFEFYCWRHTFGTRCAESGMDKFT